MTRLTLPPLVRETAFVEHGRPLVIELYSTCVHMRFKGTRKTWVVTYEAMLWHAVRRDAEQQRRERGAKRKGRS